MFNIDQIIKAIQTDPNTQRTAMTGAAGLSAGLLLSGGKPTKLLGNAAKLGAVDQPWSPHIVAQLNDLHVKVAKLDGEFVWHHHPDTDELFLVVAGRLRIELPDRAVSLGPGELFVVPRGVEHRPVASDGCQIVLIEPAGTSNTGSADTDHRGVAGTTGAWL